MRGVMMTDLCVKLIVSFEQSNSCELIIIYNSVGWIHGNM